MVGTSRRGEAAFLVHQTETQLSQSKGGAAVEQVSLERLTAIYMQDINPISTRSRRMKSRLKMLTANG
jgi:hypothetical protein